MMGNGLRGDPPSTHVRAVIMEHFLAAHKSVRWEIPKDFLTRTHFNRAILRLDMRSSPGYPYMLTAPTNGDYFKIGEEWNEDRINHMWELVNLRIRTESEADPIRTFIKPEPHTDKKILEGRYRIISSVSVADQLIDHMLFGDMNDLLIKNWMFVPSKAGWSFLHGGWKLMPRSEEDHVAIDKSAWDWTVKLWLVEMILECRLKSCTTQGELLSFWYEKAAYRYRQLFCEAVFITSGGLMLKQLDDGIMKSGCVNTISDNSMMQYILHTRVCLENGFDIGRIMSMGDDTLQQKPEDLSLYLWSLGQFCKVKQADSLVEFAGFRFQGMRVEPCYRGKHAFTLLHVDDDVVDDMALSYSLMYHRSSYRGWTANVFRSLGCEIPNTEWLDAVFDGEI